MRDLERDQLSCLVCGSTENLNKVKITGFILVCEDCFEIVPGKEIVVELHEPQWIDEMTNNEPH